MRHRLFGSMAVVPAMLALLSLPMGSAAGQAPSYTPARTPDGQPDIQGMWLPTDAGQPVENPAEAPASGGGRGGRGAGGRAQPAMVVEPPDGIIPLQPWAWTKREEIMRNQSKLVDLDPRVRCLPSGVPRVHMPIDYNTYQFLQIPGFVILVYEWNHLYRVIPLDGRPHVNPNVHLWMGDSRGHWEGNTLVVDVTNFTDKTWVVGVRQAPEGAPVKTYTNGNGVFHTDALHVVERFTRVAEDTIRYEATIEDPNVFTRPWTIRFDAFKKAPKDHMLYEYGCWEGGRVHLPLMLGIDITSLK